jgi:Mce-associated membrane protein
MSGKSESEAPDADDAVSAESAEAAAAAAEERAEAARARANELRRKLEASRDETPAPPETVTEVVPATETQDEPEAAESEASEADPVDTEPTQPTRDISPKTKRGLRLATVAAVLAVLVVIAALLSVTGYMLWQHRNADQLQHRNAEFAAAARQDVVNLMSLDYTHAKESIQRIIDGSTGKFKSNFEDGSGDLIKALQDAKVATKVTVNNAAVESTDKDSATVLVAATSQRTGPDAPKEDQQPRVWRVVVSVVREGDQVKMSDVEFA